jgi:hypothetical protein
VTIRHVTLVDEHEEGWDDDCDEDDLTDNDPEPTDADHETE